MSAPELPRGYHVENLSRLLNSVMDQYADLLEENEHKLFSGFQCLSAQGKSLYYRLLTRRGQAIRIDKLNYADIDDLHSTMQELCRSDMATINSHLEPDALLNLLTRQELVKLFPIAGHSKLAKHSLIEHINQHHKAEILQSEIGQHYPYAEALFQPAFETFKVCFFGNSHQDLTEFVVNDLGHVQYERYSLCKATRYFQTRQQIETQISYSNAKQQLEDSSLLQDKNALIALANSLPLPDQHAHINRRYQKVIITIARQLERLTHLDAALALYRQCNLHPCRERSARILRKQGLEDESLHICSQIVEQSKHPEELEFALRFQGKRQQTQTWQNHNLHLPNSGASVEIQAACALSDQQHKCYYMENSLINGLFGLMFWDIIFSAVNGAFINPFQRAPLDLFSETFYERRQQAINNRLALLQPALNQPLKQPQAALLPWQQLILDHFHHKQGLANPFVYWEQLPLDLLELAITSIPAADLHCIFIRILQHPGLFRNGFPDLIRFSNTGYELIEVKGPGDKLQANQTRWLKYFQKKGIPSSVVWVSWLDGNTQ